MRWDAKPGKAKQENRAPRSQSRRREFLGSAVAAVTLPFIHRLTRAEPSPQRLTAASTSKIDIHVHLGRSSQEMAHLTKEKLPELVNYLTGEMDRHNVEKSLIVAVEPEFPTELYLDAAKLAPERLMVACSVIPRPLDRALENLRAFHERGAKALKLQPMQYDPHDPAVERLVGETVKLGMPVLFHHTDLPKSFPDMLSHFASTFPSGDFVVIHFGGVYGFWDVLPLARMPNVYLETSTAFSRIVKSPLRQMLHFLVEENRLNKLVFGSELPSDYESVFSAIDDLLGPDPQPDVVKAIFRRNADRMLKLSLSSQLRTDEEQREKNANAAEVFKALGVRPGSRVAEVGAGDGFWVVRLAALVGKSGHVYAEDISQAAIGQLKRRVKEDEIENMEVIQGEVSDPKLTAGSLDGILIVDAYHEITEYATMLRHIREALKPGGKLVIMDRADKKENRQEPRSKQVAGHLIAPELVEPELKEAGFEVTERRDPFRDSPGGRIAWLMVARRPS